MLEGPEGQIYLGGIDGTGNWGFPRFQRIALHRIDWQEAQAFELSQVQARANGFVLKFSAPIADAVQDTSMHLKLNQWHYQTDGSRSAIEPLAIDSISFSDDRTEVFVQCAELSPKKVVHLKLNELLLSQAGDMILNPEAWYTLNEIPDRNGPN